MLYRKQMTFTSSQSWTFPSTALAAIEYIIRAGGGAGAGTVSGQTGARGGGGGGGYRRGYQNLTPGDTYSIIVGAGGAGSTGAGTDGGDSEIVGVVKVFGGKGAAAAASGNIAGGFSGDGIPPLATGSFSTSPPYAPWMSGSGSSGVANAALGPSMTSHGECIGGAGASSAQPAITFAIPPGSGEGGLGTSSATRNGGDATVIGCGGGGATGWSGLNSTGGDGYRGQIDIIYWDTVP